jgi:hypothetical protein
MFSSTLLVLGQEELNSQSDFQIYFCQEKCGLDLDLDFGFNPDFEDTGGMAD